jgi:hypothetical protein
VRTIVVVAVVALSTAAFADTSASPPARATVERVRFETTPGKPMQLAVPDEPAERIEVWREGGKNMIQVTRNVGKERVEGRAQLDDADWKQIEAVIAAHKLSTWQARPSKPHPIYDYSSSGFAILSGTRVVNEQHWAQPVEQIGDPVALAQLLGALAKRKVARPALFYF